MIELVSSDRCIKCNLCVNVCPTNVFNAVPNAAPRIARQSDCQTCFMCELYCPVDALFVAAEVTPLPAVNEEDLVASGILGSYRRDIGWQKGQTPQAQADTSYQFSRMRS